MVADDDLLRLSPGVAGGSGTRTGETRPPAYLHIWDQSDVPLPVVPEPREPLRAVTAKSEVRPRCQVPLADDNRFFRLEARAPNLASG